MKKLCIYLLFLITQLIANGQQAAEYYYVEAFNKMSDMLVGRDTLSIKKAVFLAEWAYYEGRLDYKTDFCDEIDRIIDFVRLFYEVNKLSTFKTGKQMALNEYFLGLTQEMDINHMYMITKHYQRMKVYGKNNLYLEF